LTLGRDILKPVLGNAYSLSFDVLGLIGSLMIPSTTEDLLPILQAFKAFFVANPTLEDVARNITAAQAQLLHDQLLAAQANVNSQVTITQNQKEARDVAAEQVRLRIRAVIDEMGQVLSPLDARRLSFGFNRPGATETPDMVEGLIATLMGPSMAALKWNMPARANYFRVWKKVIGVDTEPVAVGYLGCERRWRKRAVGTGHGRDSLRGRPLARSPTHITQRKAEEKSSAFFF
jgi:hypothetical protein